MSKLIYHSPSTLLNHADFMMTENKKIGIKYLKKNQLEMNQPRRLKKDLYFLKHIEYYNYKRIKVKLKGLTVVAYRNQALQAD